MLTFVKTGGACLLAACAAMANAVTIATFADPTSGPVVPMFTMTSTSISGGYTGNGLMLETPGFPGADVPNALFTMTPVTLTQIVPGFYLSGGGTITFTDSVLTPVLFINFTSGQATFTGFGGNAFTASNVTFSGPGVPPNLTDGAFAFAFANVQQNAGITTATASFTSSAVPEPATMGILAIGGLAMAIRRRRKNR